MAVPVVLHLPTSGTRALSDVTGRRAPGPRGRDGRSQAART
jgi:hypothetical protein